MGRERILHHPITRNVLRFAGAAALVGSILKSHDVPIWQQPTMQFQKGLNVLLWGGGVDDPKTDPTCDNSYFCQQTTGLMGVARDDGFTTIVFNFPVFQNTAESNDVYIRTAPDSGTPSDHVLESLTDKAHALGEQIVWRPILDERNLKKENPKNWRGNIRPKNPQLWMANYEKIIMHYARLAAQKRVDVFSVGDALNTLEQNPGFITLINNVRTVYSGNITYSWNWEKTFTQQQLSMAKYLDYAGLDELQDLNVPLHPTVSQIEYAQTAVKKSIIQMQKIIQIPLVLTDYGVPSQDGGIQQPWQKANNKLPQDTRGQAEYYIASCKKGGVIDQVNGWDVSADGPFDGRPEYYSQVKNSDAIISYPPKPAEEIVAQQCNSPR